MNILWFTNTPCGATEKLTGKPVFGGGWLYALSEHITKSPAFDLHIAFYWGDLIGPFQYKGITYHPIYQEGEGGKFGRLINRYVSAHSDSIDKRSLPRLLDVIKDVQPDLIHIHGSESNFGLIAKEELKCPIVLSIQGLLSPIYSVFYRGFTKKEISKYEGFVVKFLMSGISMKEKSMRRRGAMERDFINSIPNVIGRTFWDKACSLALNPRRSYYEVGEILRSDFYNANWDKRCFSTPFIIITTISVGYYKGLETVYQTAQILKNTGFEFVWNIIGLSDSDILARMSEKKIGLSASSSNIHFLGRKNAEQMVQLMKGADLYVQVSHIENSSNSLGEAMLLGMPILATFAGGTASMLENNIEGRLLQDGEPYSMAGMIMEMSLDFQRAKQMGNMARETALKRHNPEHVFNQLLAAYNSILQNSEN